MGLVCNATPQWARLEAHFQSWGAKFDLQQAFAEDGRRLGKLSQQAPYVFADLSKNWLAEGTEQHLSALARACGVHGLRDTMLSGAAINATEQRAVMHWLLRTPRDGGLLQSHPVVQAWTAPMQLALQEVHCTLDAMLALAEQVRSDARIIGIMKRFYLILNPFVLFIKRK